MVLYRSGQPNAKRRPVKNNTNTLKRGSAQVSKRKHQTPPKASSTLLPPVPASSCRLRHCGGFHYPHFFFFRDQAVTRQKCLAKMPGKKCLDIPRNRGILSRCFGNWPGTNQEREAAPCTLFNTVGKNAVGMFAVCKTSHRDLIPNRSLSPVLCPLFIILRSSTVHC
jgi:hypothetical protein